MIKWAKGEVGQAYAWPARHAVEVAPHYEDIPHESRQRKLESSPSSGSYCTVHFPLGYAQVRYQGPQTRYKRVLRHTFPLLHLRGRQHAEDPVFPHNTNFDRVLRHLPFKALAHRE